MSALELFKRAGIEDYIKPGLVGAGIGGAGMGLASMFGGEDGETPGDKRKRILGNMLKGTALGGAAGLGYQGLKDLAGSTQDPGIQGLKDKLMGRTGKELDTEPFGVHHPGAQKLVNLTHADTTTDAAVGAGVGGTGTAVNGFRGQRAFDAARADALKHNIPLAEQGDHMANHAAGISSQGVKQRVLEKMLESQNGQGATHSPGGGVQQVHNWMDKLHLGSSDVHQQQLNAGKNLNMANSAQGKFQATPYEIPAWATNPDPRTWNSGATTAEPRWSQGVREWAANRAGSANHPFAGASAGRYLRNSAGTAAAFAAAGVLGRTAVDNTVFRGYDPEQLQAWNKMQQ